MHSHSISTQGKVYLVGAGPGEPELITVRGANLLKKADVVVYDRLANPKLLAHTSDKCEHIYVGKRPGRASISQEQINNILINKAREEKTTVRLKGGDAFIFGRGGEECEVLRSAAIPFEVVPGISSAIAAPAYAGIPLTYRKAARSFTVVTGHTVTGNGIFDNWNHITDADTLVILMGVRKMEAIAERLINLGREVSTPAAVIERATYDDQKMVAGTLGTIAEKASHVSPPATIVVGEMAAMSHDINWFQLQQTAEENNSTLTVSNIAG